VRTIYNPHTKATYLLDKHGQIVETINNNPVIVCTNCNTTTPPFCQNGTYKGLCKICRRIAYYKDNRKRENLKCREYYATQNGKERMKERRFGGNWQKTLDRDGNHCVVCQMTNDLTVHHKDETGMKSVGSYKKSNNSPNNLVTLCRSCHSKLHNGTLPIRL
jgi:predicted metal-binding protein